MSFGVGSLASPAYVQRNSPVSVYLFPGEDAKLHALPEGEDLDADGLGSAANDLQCDMGSEAESESSTDNDDFCILEAPGMGIPVSLLCLLLFLPGYAPS